MESLPHRHLTTLHLDIDLAEVITLGPTPAGQRAVAPIAGGRFEGDRLSGTVRPGGSDWVTIRPDGSLMIDVRLLLDTADGAVIALAYRGTFVGDAATVRRFMTGEPIDRADYALTTVARFESGDQRYAWLNDATVVAIGEQTAIGPAYIMYEIGR